MFYTCITISFAPIPDIVIEENEPVFHQDWEKRAFGILLGTLGQGLYNLDEMRHGWERMNPVDFLTSGYYGHWLAAVERNLVEKNILDAAELEARTKAFLTNPNEQVPNRENPDLVNHMKLVVQFGAPTHREATAAPRFKVGDRVKTRNINPSGHTRLPRYARDKYGVIEAAYGVHVFPDAHAHGEGENPEHLYSVRIEADELWGLQQKETVNIDLWESHLEPASN